MFTYKLSITSVAAAFQLLARLHDKLIKTCHQCWPMIRYYYNLHNIFSFLCKQISLLQMSIIKKGCFTSHALIERYGINKLKTKGVIIQREVCSPSCRYKHYY